MEKTEYQRKILHNIQWKIKLGNGKIDSPMEKFMIQRKILLSNEKTYDSMDKSTVQLKNL